MAFVYTFVYSYNTRIQLFTDNFINTKYMSWFFSSFQVAVFPLNGVLFNKFFCLSSCIFICSSLSLIVNFSIPIDSLSLFNPNRIGVKYFIVLGRKGLWSFSVFCPPYLLVKKNILNWNFRYFSWLRQYQTGIFFFESSVFIERTR